MVVIWDHKTYLKTVFENPIFCQMRRAYQAKISTLTETHNKEIEREQSCKKMDYSLMPHSISSDHEPTRLIKKFPHENYTLLLRKIAQYICRNL